MRLQWLTLWNLCSCYITIPCDVVHDHKAKVQSFACMAQHNGNIISSFYLNASLTLLLGNLLSFKVNQLA